MKNNLRTGEDYTADEILEEIQLEADKNLSKCLTRQKQMELRK